MEKQKTATPEEIRAKIQASLPTLEVLGAGDDDSKNAAEDVAATEEEKPQEDTQVEKKEEGVLQSEEKPAEIDYAEQARNDGWVPKDEFKGDPVLWVDAKEWISRGPLLHKISSQGKELKNMAKTNNAMAEMLQNLTERLDKERTDKILSNKKEAIEQGDVAAVEHYEKEYNEIIDNAAKITKIPSAPSMDAETEDFVQRNSNWFNDKPENLALTAYAKQIETELMNTRPELTLKARLLATENIVKEDPRYKSKFTNSNRDRAPLVEGKTSPVTQSRNKITFADLPSDAKRVLLAQKESFERFSNVKTPFDLDKMAQRLLDTGAIKYE
jgi:hypothetical protein